MDRLRKCPFCDSENVGLRGGIEIRFVHCDDCEANGPVSVVVGEDTNQRAIDAWNNRPYVSQFARVIEDKHRLERTIKDLRLEIDALRDGKTRK